MVGPDYVLFQFSDLHIVPDGQQLYGTVDTLANLVAALDVVELSHIRPAALVFSGDLTEAGEPESYERLKSVVAPVAERLDAPAIYAMGNHDLRANVREILLGETGTDLDAELDTVHWIEDLRVITLDTSVPKRIEGELSDGQLEWLRAELATPAPAGTVVVMHHPPFPVRVTLQPFVLAAPESLADVLRGSDVRIILCGHAHQSAGGSLAGIPVWVSGATSYRLDALSPNLKGLGGTVLSRVDLYADCAVATQVPVSDGPALYEVTGEELLARGSG